jgi:hypothetical protein
VYKSILESLYSCFLLASLAKGGEVVRFSGFARKTNHIPPFFASEASKKKPKRKLLKATGNSL